MLAGPLGYNLPHVTMVTCSTDLVSMPAALSTVKLKAHPKTQNLLLKSRILRIIQANGHEINSEKS
jgi:hypothetical protein